MDKRKKKLKENNAKPKMEPTIQRKQEYLKLVKANDCQKDKVTGCYKVEPARDTKSTQEKKELKITKK